MSLIKIEDNTLSLGAVLVELAKDGFLVFRLLFHLFEISQKVLLPSLRCVVEQNQLSSERSHPPNQLNFGMFS